MANKQGYNYKFFIYYIIIIYSVIMIMIDILYNSSLYSVSRIENIVPQVVVYLICVSKMMIDFEIDYRLMRVDRLPR